MIQSQWLDDQRAIKVIHETQTFNQQTGGMDHEVHGEITMPPEEWLHLVAGVLNMLKGQPDAEGKPVLPLDAGAPQIAEVLARLMQMP